MTQSILNLDPDLEAGETLKVEVLDDAGPGGAHHAYRVSWPEGSITIPFQRGPRKETNYNGILEASLLAILEHRLTSFQEGPYPSDENEVALQAIRTARDAQKARARDRLNRGVLGTSQK